MNPSQILLLPGWQNSGPGHWQTEWERLHGYQRVQQHPWMLPVGGHHVLPRRLGEDLLPPRGAVPVVIKHPFVILN
ncbi:alpha/beta hydrolase [Klebsiella pneumoniae]|uniref:alpha/beta hydrolase n=1 Tax=Klebsiella pneumoniae TaxID=573 RepID=UPI0039B9026A|nr:alpha/beta hydrolase [Klebsiella pneumoniae]